MGAEAEGIYSADTERILLGNLLSHGSDAYSIVSPIVKESDFYLDSHRKIYSSIEKLVEEGKRPDIVLLMESLKASHSLSAVGGLSYIADLTSSVMPSLHAETLAQYARIIENYSLRRRLVGLAQVVIDSGAEDVHQLKDHLLRGFDSLSESKGLEGYADVVEREGHHDPMQMMEEILRPDLSKWVRSGFADLDKMIGGFKGGDIVIVAGRPGSGKTSFALNVANNVSRDKTVAFFSLEMGRKALLKRLISCTSEVDLKKVQYGVAVSEVEEERARQAYIQVLESGLRVDDTPAVTVGYVSATSKATQRSEGVDLIVIDYLQLIRGDKSYARREEEVSYLSRSLKAMARDLDVPVIVLAQLSRENEKRADKRPMLSDLRESGAIEQDADVVMFVHREEYYNRDDPEVKGLAEIIVAKQREGPVGKVNMGYVDKYTKFHDLEWKRDQVPR